MCLIIYYFSKLILDVELEHVVQLYFCNCFVVDTAGQFIRKHRDKFSNKFSA